MQIKPYQQLLLYQSFPRKSTLDEKGKNTMSNEELKIEEIEMLHSFQALNEEQRKRVLEVIRHYCSLQTAEERRAYAAEILR